MSVPILLKKRIPSEPMVNSASGTLSRPLPAARIPAGPDKQSGALSRIMKGIFGTANPIGFTSSLQVATPGPQSLYHYHEGDVFTAGAPGYVFEYPFEYPIMTIWGNAFLRRPNVFSPYQPAQVFSQPNVVINGIGGLQAGEFALQGLESENQ